MTPKEKANELFYKMNDKILLCQPKVFKSANIAKEIAIITVDEILSNAGLGLIMTNWWNKVKQELELL